MFGINTTTIQSSIARWDGDTTECVNPASQSNKLLLKTNAFYGCEQAPDSTPPSSITRKQKSGKSRKG